MSNILITSAGRRVGLAKAFTSELNAKLPDATVYTTDLNPKISAACSFSQKSFCMPIVTDPSYPDLLLELCIDNAIKMVVPTIDTELLILSNVKKRFCEVGIHIVVSDVELIKACRDKRITSELFSSLNMQSPQIYQRENIHFPCFVKPYDGSCSVGAQVVATEEDMTRAMNADEKLMFMELVDQSYTEFTIDAYYDLGGNLKCLVPRERIEVRGGEVSKGVTRKGDIYKYLLDKIKFIQGARGVLTIQLFAKAGSSNYYALEINPRFGGGYPLSYHAGANYPSWLISEYLLGEEIQFNDDWKPDLLMLRYDSEVFVNDYPRT